MEQTLPYESAIAPEARAPRPWWVYAVVAVYVLIVGGLVILAFALPLLSGDSAYPAAAAVTTVLVACEMAMLLIPVRFASRRPVTRRALWVPLLGSATLAGLLGLGGALAVSEYVKLADRYMWVVFATGGVV